MTMMKENLKMTMMKENLKMTMMKERAYELLNYAQQQPALDASITEFRVEVADIRRPPNYHGAT